VVLDIATRPESGDAITALRQHGRPLRDVPVGYMKKSAALDQLLLMLSSTAAAGPRAA
jgi:hypothetical protein